MHGVPANIDLTRFHGAELIQICLGLAQLQFHFHTGVSVSVEGTWELRDAEAAVLDRSYDGLQRPPYRLHHLLGLTVVGSEVTPESIALRFANGDVLRLFDSSDTYESFEIQPGNIVV